MEKFVRILNLLGLGLTVLIAVVSLQLDQESTRSNEFLGMDGWKTIVLKKAFISSFVMI